MKNLLTKWLEYGRIVVKKKRGWRKAAKSIQFTTQEIEYLVLHGSGVRYRD